MKTCDSGCNDVLRKYNFAVAKISRLDQVLRYVDATCTIVRHREEGKGQIIEYSSSGARVLFMTSILITTPPCWNGNAKKYERPRTGNSERLFLGNLNNLPMESW